MNESELFGQGALRRVLGDAEPREDAERRIARGAMARIQAQRSRRRVAYVGLAAAALAAGIVCVVWLVRAPAVDLAPGPRGGLAGRVLGPPPPPSHALGPHRVLLAEGARVRVEQRSPTAARLRVLAGRATFEVEPLPPGGSFCVLTPQVRVEVVGTRFSVTSRGRCSDVEVTEGKVRVTALLTGEQLLMRSGKKTFCQRSDDPSSRDLDEGGKLVRRALALLDSDGGSAEADRLLSEYLQRYPEGPFAEEALFYRVFTHRRLGRAREAKQLAAEFLRRFPATPRAARLRAWLAGEGQGE